MEQVAEHENSSTYSRIKEWIFETIQPEMSRSAKTTVFNIIVLALIFVSVGIVFAATFNLPQTTMEILKKVEFWIAIVFTIEYALRIWTANLLYPRKNWFMARVCYVFSPMAWRLPSQTVGRAAQNARQRSSVSRAAALSS